MKKLIRETIIAIVWIVGFVVCCYIGMADELQVNMTCYPKQLQLKFAERGYKLDLSANDRDEKSWGFISSKGNSYSIFTYSKVSRETLKDIMGIIGG